VIGPGGVDVIHAAVKSRAGSGGSPSLRRCAILLRQAHATESRMESSSPVFRRLSVEHEFSLVGSDHFSVRRGERRCDDRYSREIVPETSAVKSGHRSSEDVEELRYATAAVGSLLIQLRHKPGLAPAGRPRSETTAGVTRRCPMVQMLSPEVSKIEGHNDRRSAVECGRCYVAILFIVRHPGNQPVVAADPCLTEVSS